MKRRKENECRNTCSWSRLIRPSLFLCLFPIYLFFSARFAPVFAHCLTFHAILEYEQIDIYSTGMSERAPTGIQTLSSIVRAPTIKN